MWLKDVDCDRHDVHILRCQHVVTSGSERLSCNSSLLVQCGKKESLVGCINKNFINR